MVPWLLLLLPLPFSVAASLEKTLGVHPDLLSKYTPSKANTWKCLDGSKEIPWEFVNDDSCDCADGSDEPGTSACPNSKFYCRNEGHVGAYIPSSRVGDGLCEPQCCDGSDERPEVCQNRCKVIGEEYRKKRDEERRLQKTGAKIRSTYITFAHKEKKRLENLLTTLTQQITDKTKEVDRLRDIAERTESISQVALEQKKESPFYKSIIIHNKALKSLQREYKKHLEREKALGQILDTLRRGYNPNYQDMAVLEAVRGWEELAGLPHINDVTKEEQPAAGETKEEEAKKDSEEPLEEGMWTADQLEHQLDGLLDTDYVSLLLDHEEHINAPVEGSLLYDLASYLPDSVIPQYENFKDSLVSWLQKFGILREDLTSATAESTRAHQALTDAENELNRLKTERSNTEGDIADIFDVEAFGAEGEWKKLDNTCLELNTGDYTYEVCMFQEARQKPNNGGQTFSLGKYESWNPSPDVKPGEPEYYQKQIYKHGTRCWNGPERNVAVIFACGTENAILTVQELEKCEYQITGTTPALCLPLNGEKKNVKEEL